LFTSGIEAINQLWRRNEIIRKRKNENFFDAGEEIKERCRDMNNLYLTAISQIHAEILRGQISSQCCL